MFTGAAVAVVASLVAGGGAAENQTRLDNAPARWPVEPGERLIEELPLRLAPVTEVRWQGELPTGPGVRLQVLDPAIFPAAILPAPIPPRRIVYEFKHAPDPAVRSSTPDLLRRPPQSSLLRPGDRAILWGSESGVHVSVEQRHELEWDEHTQDYQVMGGVSGSIHIPLTD